MWKMLGEANFTASHFILGGDFNHFEETSRRGIVEERQMHRREATMWHHLTLQYDMSDVWKLDSFRKMTRKKFMFDNGRFGMGSTLSHINKFLVFQELNALGGRIEAASSIKKFSDHSPFIITIWGQPANSDMIKHYLDLSLLREKESRAEMLLAWEGSSLKPTVGSESAT
jgi:hypothetical protein